jgi:hypothetical protein
MIPPICESDLRIMSRGAIAVNGGGTTEMVVAALKGFGGHAKEFSAVSNEVDLIPVLNPAKG